MTPNEVHTEFMELFQQLTPEEQLKFLEILRTRVSAQASLFDLEEKDV